jgi:cholesterol transport system auxiliary component
MNHPGFSILIAAAFISITTCSIPGPSQQTAKQFFVLQDQGVSIPAPDPASKPCFSLRITTPGSTAGLNTTRMAYSNKPNRLDYYAYHEWVAPPAKMIASLMESRLQANGLFTSVMVGSPDVRTDFRLDSELQVLQQDFTANGDHLNLAIRVDLVESATRALLGSETFAYRETAGGNAEAGVEAANRAVNRFLAELTVFLDSLTREMECSK